MGYVVTGAEPVSRLVRIVNHTESSLQMTGWKVSCECLSVEPSAVEIGPKMSIYVRLRYDADKDGDNTGSLLIAVEGFAGRTRACAFDVPITVISPADVEHLEM
jgi:hypothetical protein